MAERQLPSNLRRVLAFAAQRSTKHDLSWQIRESRRSLSNALVFIVRFAEGDRAYRRDVTVARHGDANHLTKRAPDYLRRAEAYLRESVEVWRYEGKRAVRFNFGGEGGPFSTVFDGYTDDTYWNGWLNVWVEPEQYRQRIRPHFLTPTPYFAPDGSLKEIPPAYNEADEAISDLDEAARIAEAAGDLLSLANCYITCEVPSKTGEDKWTPRN